MDEIIEKPCKKCGIVKPLSEFYEHKNYADGHTRICKECWNEKYKDTTTNQVMSKLDEIIDKLDKVIQWIEKH